MDHDGNRSYVDEDKGVVITTKTLITWGGLLIAIVGGIVAISMWLFTIKAENQLQQVQIDISKADIVELKRRDEERAKNLNDMQRNLDRALIILERLDSIAKKDASK